MSLKEDSVKRARLELEISRVKAELRWLQDEHILNRKYLKVLELELKG